MMRWSSSARCQYTVRLFDTLLKLFYGREFRPVISVACARSMAHRGVFVSLFVGWLKPTLSFSIFLLTATTGVSFPFGCRRKVDASDVLFFIVFFYYFFDFFFFFSSYSDGHIIIVSFFHTPLNFSLWWFLTLSVACYYWMCCFFFPPTSSLVSSSRDGWPFATSASGWLLCFQGEDDDGDDDGPRKQKRNNNNNGYKSDGKEL